MGIRTDRCIAAETAYGVFNEDTGSLILTALDPPAAGCWQVSARYAQEPPLVFVISVP